MKTLVVSFVGALSVASCASAAPPPKVDEPPPAPEPKADERSLPTSCGDGPVCVPPKEFAERVCAGTYPELALHMFAPKTPWKRAYVLRAFQAWHVGGHGDMRELKANEEVLILSVGRGGGEGQLGGKAFDVFRWDGTCVSLMEDEITFQKPSGAVPANIAWKKLDPNHQAVFAGDRGIESLRATQSKLCESPAAEQEPGKTKCELSRRQLSQAMAQLVARGKALPELSSLP
jgi:hypothetical protein